MLKAAQLYDKNALTPEWKIDMSKEPDHYMHWYYDKDNPFQKKIAPVRTFVEFDKESEKITS